MGRTSARTFAAFSRLPGHPGELGRGSIEATFHSNRLGRRVPAGGRGAEFLPPRASKGSEEGTQRWLTSGLCPSQRVVNQAPPFLRLEGNTVKAWPLSLCKPPFLPLGSVRRARRSATLVCSFPSQPPQSHHLLASHTSSPLPTPDSCKNPAHPCLWHSLVTVSPALFEPAPPDPSQP